MLKTEVNLLEQKITEKMERSFLRRAGIKKPKENAKNEEKKDSSKNIKLTNDLDLEKVFDENRFKLCHILLDLHEAFNIQPSYEFLTELEVFKTPEDIVDYFKSRLSDNVAVINT